MRWALAFLGTFLCCGHLLAVGRERDAKPARPLKRAEAEAFAKQLDSVVREITQCYVWPISRTELLQAAISGLYEMVREPVPRDLRMQLERAAKGPESLQLIIRIREKLGDQPAIRSQAGLLVSVQAMMRLLDPYSGVSIRDDPQDDSDTDTIRGLGFEATGTGVGPLVIQKVVPGSPAQKAGLRPGDQITHVGDAKREETSQAAKNSGPIRLVSLREKDRQVEQKFRVRRPSSTGSFEVKLAVAEFKPETVLGISRLDNDTWSYWLDKQRKIAHVRIASLGRGTSDDLQQALSQLKQDGLCGLILDLRWCPGGYLNQATSAVSLFLNEGLIARIKYRGSHESEEHRSPGNGVFMDFPVVVLVNGETAGGAELIAAALQENKRAVVLGQRTLGKASIQNMLDLPVPNASMKLTTGIFLRPSGKNLHRFPDSKPTDDWGVRPDAKLELPITPDLDRQLRDWWLLQTLRPASRNEALPLDDPEKDPQQQAALRALIEGIQ